MKKGFASAVRLAKLDIKVTPHTLRHTAATWLMHAGVKEWDAAGYLGMSVEILHKVYGHHHPDYMKSAVEGISSKPNMRKPYPCGDVQSSQPASAGYKVSVMHEKLICDRNDFDVPL